MISLLQVPPSLIMIIGAFILPFVGRPLRLLIAPALPLLTLAHIWQIPVGENLIDIQIAGFNLMPLYAHPYTHIFATIFAIAAFGGTLYGLLQTKTSELCAALLYAGSAIGVTFSGDLISLFLYWELMAIGSTFVIFASSLDGSKRSGMRYALMHLMGGVLLMSGIIAHLIITGDAAITSFDASMAILFPKYMMFDAHGIILWLMLIGILINAGAPPFSAWLPDSYPLGSPFGSVFLSAFTTKTAVFVLLTMFAGTKLLIFVGIFMIFYGIVFAILENDMRRILSYSIINQVGFMITGIGIGTEMSLNGVAVHAFCHIIYKALLFMSAGSVLYMTGRSRCSDLGGLYHTMKLTAFCGIIGALAISAFPLTSGFVSKSLITSAAAHEDLAIVWFALVAASAGVFLHAGIKFPWFVFFQKDSGLRPKEPPFNMKLAMVLFSALCIIPAIPGWADKTLYFMLPNVVTYEAYSTEHVVQQIQLLLFSGLAFFVMLPLLKRTETITLDFDWFYRSFARYIVIGSYKILVIPYKYIITFANLVIQKTIDLLSHTHGPDGIMARNMPIGVTVMWSLALLGVYMFLYYV